VAGFRLKMATQAGEQVARDEGFTSLPVKPLVIVERKDLHVEKKPPGMKGVSGALIFMEPKPLLIYSSEHQNAGFENFSIAHELGHLVNNGHLHTVASLTGLDTFDDEESAADQTALRLMRAAQLRPRAMVTMLAKVARDCWMPACNRQRIAQRIARIKLISGAD